MKSILSDGIVLPMTETLPILEGRDLWIDDDRIIAIKEHDPKGHFEAELVIDAQDCLIMPGLINAHTHTPMTLMRSIRDDQESFLKPGYSSMLPLDQDWTMKLTADDHEWASRLAIAEMIRCGTTTFVDMYHDMDRVARAVIESGVRASLGWEIFSVRRDPNTWLPYDKSVGQRTYEESARFAAEWNGKGDGRVIALIAPHETGTCHEPWLSRAAALATELGVDITLHLAESEHEVRFCQEKYGLTPAELLEKSGLVQHHLLAAHCLYLSSKDITQLANHDFHVAVCPQGYLKLGHRMPPIQEMLEKGLNLSLGTDSALGNNNLDLWEECRLMTLMQKYLTGDPSALPGMASIWMATAGAAKALNRSHEIGTLEAGKKADLILIDTSRPHWHPIEGVLKGNLMYAANSSDVCTVLVDGQMIMQDWKILTFDEEAVIREADRRVRNLRESVGLPPTYKRS